MTTANRFPPAANETELYCPACDQSFGEGVAHCPNDGTRLVRLNDVKDPLIGRNLDRRFLIKERLGTGGMGAVYRAWQGSVGREVAVKVIEARLKGGRLAAKRFLREAKLASRLSHANTVSVIDFGQTEDGLLYLVMELVKGRTLGDVLLEDGHFGVDRMVRIGVQLCDALEAAHKLAIIHRDLKPSNIIVLDEPAGRDHVKVLDFGLAKSLVNEGSTTMTQSDAIMGTPSYIPPEAVTLMQFDERSDLYSLGVILYEALAGRLPFSATTVQEMLRQHAYDQPQALPPEVIRPVAGFVYQLLAKQPDHRPQTAGQVRDTLLAFAGVPDRLTPLPLSAPVDMRYSGPVTGERGAVPPVRFRGPPRSDPVAGAEVALVAVGQHGRGAGGGRGGRHAGVQQPPRAGGAGRPAGRAGRPVRRTGRPAGRAGRPAGRAGRHAGRAGRPVRRTGRPAGRAGRPAGRAGRHAARGRHPRLGDPRRLEHRCRQRRPREPIGRRRRRRSRRRRSRRRRPRARGRDPHHQPADRRGGPAGDPLAGSHPARPPVRARRPAGRAHPAQGGIPGRDSPRGPGPGPVRAGRAPPHHPAAGHPPGPRARARRLDPDATDPPRSHGEQASAGVGSLSPGARDPRTSSPRGSPPRPTRWPRPACAAPWTRR